MKQATYLLSYLVLALLLAGCGGGSGSDYVAAPQTPGWPIADEVFTTAERQIMPMALLADTPQINPREVELYAQFGYSAWQVGGPLPHTRRTDLAPGNVATNATRLLSFFTMSDIHISDKESPAQSNWVGWSAVYGPTSNQLSSAYSPVILSTTQVLDAAVQTINVLHKKSPFDFGISLGDTINNTQYNELRWYIDVIDGKVITPSSGAHAGAGTIDYQMPYKAAGLDKSLLWYQTIGNHDQFMMGSFYEFDKTLAAHIGTNVINYENNPTPTYAGIHGTGFYMGVVDGTTPYGDIIKGGPQDIFAGVVPQVVADPDRRSLVSATSSSQNWISEFFNTTTNPVGHGFNLVDPANGPGFACYSFQPKSGIPIKVIVLDDTCKGDADPTNPNINYAAGCLDAARFNWLKAELAEGQTNNKLMIIAAHVPVYPYNSLTDPTKGNMNLFGLPPTVVTDASLLTELHKYPNLMLWMSGHRHMNTITPQPFNTNDLTDTPENSFWEVETASLRDFPQHFRTFEIRRNSDNNISIIITNVDPAVRAGSPAAKSRGYAIGAARIFGATPTIIADPSSHAQNGELVKILTPTMQAVIAPLGSPIP